MKEVLFFHNENSRLSFIAYIVFRYLFIRQLLSESFLLFSAESLERSFEEALGQNSRDLIYLPI